MKEHKIIHIAVIVGKWVGGGVETVIMNYYRNIDKSKIQFDFICDQDSNCIPYEEIEKLGGKIIIIPPYQKIIKYQKELRKMFKKNNYQIVHSHINVLSIFPLFAAWVSKVPIRIAHSHSTTNIKEIKKNALKMILKPFARVFATHYFACSEHAGRWMFGDKVYDDGKVYLLNNAIDIEKFEYNEEIRKQIRNEMGIKEDTVVVGHIGRFVEQKNHSFLIDIFSQYYKKNNNSILILVGQGPLMSKIRERVKKLNLEKAVWFLGQREDVEELYQMFDVFMFPSLYEGLGMVLIEAQVSGLCCIASSEVPIASKITDNIKYIGLDNSILEWSEEIKRAERKSCVEQARENGYDIKIESIKLANMYEMLIKKD